MREASGARVGRADRVEGDLRGGSAIEEDVARPGLGAGAVVTDRGTSLEGQRSTEGDEVTIGREDGGVLDGDAVGGGTVDVFEGELTGGHVVSHVGSVGADVDGARADLGQGEAIAVHRAVVAEAFDATDIEATTRAADAGVRGQAQVADAGTRVVGRRTGIDDGAETADARAGDGEVNVVRALVGVGEVACVDVVRRPGNDFDFVAATEGGVGTETQRAGLDLRATREAVHALEDEDAGTGLDEADGAADAFLDVRGKGVGIGGDTALTDRDHGGGAAGVDDDASGGGAADTTTGQAEAVQVEGAGGDNQFTRVGTERGSRGGGVGQETDGAAVDDGLASVGVGTREREHAHTRLLHVAFADDLVGQGDVVDAVDRQGGSGSDGNIPDDGADGGAITELQGAAFDEGRTREGLGERVGEAARAGVGVGAGDAVGAAADLAEDELARAAVGVVDERAAELARRAGGDGGVIADADDRSGVRRVVEDRADDVGRRRDRAGEGLVLAVHVQVAAVEVDEGVIIDLVVARAGETDGGAGVDRRIIAEGMEAEGRLHGQHQGACVHVHPEAGVVLVAAQRERTGTVLGQVEGGTSDAVEVDVAGTADGEAVATLGEDAGDVGRNGRATVDDRTLAIDAEAYNGERLGDGLTVEVEGRTCIDRGRTRGRTKGAWVSEAEDVTRIDRGRASVVIEAGQDDRAEGAGCAHVEGVRTREDSVDGQGRTTATEAVTAGARREGSGERVERRRRDRTDHQRRVESHRDGLIGVTRQGQGTS